MSREGKLAKSTFLLSIGTFLPKLASFITLPILTRYLTTEEYGTYDLITVMVSLLLSAATLQIQTAAFRFLIDVKNDKNEIKSIVTNVFTFILPTSFVAILILYFCLQGQAIQVRILICVYYLSDILVNAARQVSRGLSKNLVYSISAIISALGKMIFTVIFVWYFRIGLLGSVIALCVASALSFIFVFFKSKLYLYIDVLLISWSKIKELLKYSWPMVPNSMSMWVMRVSDRLVVTFCMGVSANAIYAVANKIPSLLTLAQNTFTMAWQENASIAVKDDDVDAYYASMFKVVYDLMAGSLGLLIAATPILFALLIRGGYDKAYYQMPILLLALFFYSMCAYLGGIYVAYKRTRSVGITTIAAAACNLVVDIALIEYIGLYAASGSTLVSYLFLLIFRMNDVRKIVKIQYPYVHLFLVLVILVIESVLCFQRNFYLNCINFAIGVVVFCILNRGLVKTVLIKVEKVLKKKSRNNT